MIGIDRIVARRGGLLCFSRLASLGCFLCVPAAADIVVTGNVVPTPVVGDPWEVGGPLTVGDNTNGTMAVSGGSDVNNVDGFVANNAGSTGTVTVSGAGSSWNNSGDLRMGNSGTGTLNITGGGAVTVGVHGRIGNSPGGVGTATVDGPGSTLTSINFLLVGREGNGTLNIQNGGVVSDLIGGIAVEAPTNGAVTIDGVGSAWNNTEELQVAISGTATLDIQSGGVATSRQGYLAADVGGVGTVTVSGVGSAWNMSNEFQVGYLGSGILHVLERGTVSSMLGFVGVLAGGTGTMTVRGAGSTWTNSSELSIGYEGVGTLIVENGGVVSSGSSFIGTNAGGAGSAMIDGAGSMWTTTGTLTVGSGGTGNLQIKNGGRVSAAALDGSGEVTFAGGRLAITAADTIGNALVLDAGVGVIEVPTAGSTLSVSSEIDGGGELSKAGPGTLVLVGAKTYTGATRVDAGLLNIGQSYLNDLADVYVAGDARFGLNFTGTDDIDSLFIDGEAQPEGTYGGMGSGAEFELDEFAGTGTLRVARLGLVGDYNDNGRVDAADYTVWRNSLGSASALANDATPGVSAADYEVWSTNYGETILPGSGAGALAAGVPEPGSGVMLVLGGVVCGWRGRRRMNW